MKLTTPADPSVRFTHPRLYVGVVGYGLWGIFVGLAILVSHSFIPFGISHMLVGTAYIAFGIMKIIGAQRFSRYSLAKIGMNLCISLTMLVGIGLLLEYLGGNRDNNLYTIIGYIFAGAFIQVAPAQEPPLNPLTRHERADIEYAKKLRDELE